MVALTKKQFENRLLFLQKLYYGGYITEAEKKDFEYHITKDDILWCKNHTTSDNRSVVIDTDDKLHQIIVEDEFMVFEDENGNLKCYILEGN
jgi:hypothetical protein